MSISALHGTDCLVANPMFTPEIQYTDCVICRGVHHVDRRRREYGFDKHMFVEKYYNGGVPLVIEVHASVVFSYSFFDIYVALL